MGRSHSLTAFSKRYDLLLFNDEIVSVLERRRWWETHRPWRQRIWVGGEAGSFAGVLDRGVQFPIAYDEMQARIK
jgi:hypothetical protein